MATYIEYIQVDGTQLLIEVDESAWAPVKASDTSGNVIIKAGHKFEDALKSIRTSVTTLWQGLADLETDETEVTFGIKTVGEVGLFAVCKAGAEVNYEVKLKWTKPQGAPASAKTSAPGITQKNP